MPLPHLPNLRSKRQLRTAAALCAVFFALEACPLRGQVQASHLVLAVRFLEGGDLLAAEREATLASGTGRDRALALSILGAIKLEQKNYAVSAGFLESALRLNPQMAGAQLNLGNVYMLLGEPALAEPRFRAAVRLAPENFNARFALARLENEMGHYADSSAVAKLISKELQHTDAGLLLLSSNALALGDERSASLLVPVWLSLTHSESEAAVSFAQLFADRHRFDEAIAVLEHEQAEHGSSEVVSTALGDSYFQINDLTKATATYKSTLDIHGDCVGCLLGLARISELLGNSEEALSYLIRARTVSPRDPEVLFRLGKLCLQKDLYTDAIESLQTASRVQPENSSIQYVLASAYTGKKEYKLAIPILEKLLAKSPHDPLLNYSLGAVEYLNTNYDAADIHLQRSIKGDPKQVAPFYYLGLTRDRQGHVDEAKGIFHSLGDRFPDHAPTLLALGEILSRQHDYAGAKPILARAARLDPSSVKSHYQLGLVLSRLGELGAAKQEFAVVETLNTKAAQQPEVTIFPNPK